MPVGGWLESALLAALGMNARRRNGGKTDGPAKKGVSGEQPGEKGGGVQ